MVKECNEPYLVEVPEQEPRLGDLQADETYRVAVLPVPATNEANNTDAGLQPEQASQTGLTDTATDTAHISH